ncbi:omega-hydroxypalmitate O-feruloyl transferase [Mercurialis annua]|uniref:omega-hydroxypalmitate O-feruloyl transferase n=1 Tax=Mercurialis annua TaxID=3986 RepID=UPI00215F4F2C|nr:omega-hydroxypalmitate O-feruloyl transferase [Mercurialis annua]
MQFPNMFSVTSIMASSSSPSVVQELHFPHLNIPVTVNRSITVTPAGPIPAASGDSLYLSNLDDMIGARVFTPTIYFYRADFLNSAGDIVMKKLCDALALVLVPYYPLSGRLRETKNGKLEVFFGPKQGVLLIEAYSDSALAELGDLAVPNPAWSPLIYRFANEEPYKILDMPLLIAQVTLFSCGGFSLGLRLCHCICDGLGAMQFLNAWAVTARSGTLVANPEPCWDRELLQPRNPPVVKYPHIEFMRIDDGSSLTYSLWQGNLVQKCYRISREFQSQLKAAAQSNGKFACSTFDAMAAHIWRSWVKAIDVKPLEYKLRLTFSVNARHKLKNPPLKDGFYGNVVCVACAVSSVYELINGKLADTTLLVREARMGVSDEYLRSTIDYVEVDRPGRLEFGGKLSITQWTRFSMYESADFGWGRPIYAGPIDLTPTPQVSVLLPEGESDPSGRMVICICLPEPATTKFAEYLCSLDSTDADGVNMKKLVYVR